MDEYFRQDRNLALPHLNTDLISKILPLDAKSTVRGDFPRATKAQQILTSACNNLIRQDPLTATDMDMLRELCQSLTKRFHQLLIEKYGDDRDAQLYDIGEDGWLTNFSYDYSRGGLILNDHMLKIVFGLELYQKYFPSLDERQATRIEAIPIVTIGPARDLNQGFIPRTTTTALIFGNYATMKAETYWRYQRAFIYIMRGISNEVEKLVQSYATTGTVWTDTPNGSMPQRVQPNRKPYYEWIEAFEMLATKVEPPAIFYNLSSLSTMTGEQAFQRLTKFRKRLQEACQLSWTKHDDLRLVLLKAIKLVEGSNLLHANMSWISLVEAFSHSPWSGLCYVPWEYLAIQLYMMASSYKGMLEEESWKTIIATAKGAIENRDIRRLDAARKLLLKNIDYHMGVHFNNINRAEGPAR